MSHVTVGDTQNTSNHVTILDIYNIYIIILYIYNHIINIYIYDMITFINDDINHINKLWIPTMIHCSTHREIFSKS